MSFYILPHNFFPVQFTLTRPKVSYTRHKPSKYSEVVEEADKKDTLQSISPLVLIEDKEIPTDGYKDEKNLSSASFSSSPVGFLYPPTVQTSGYPQRESQESKGGVKDVGKEEATEATSAEKSS